MRWAGSWIKRWGIDREGGILYEILYFIYLSFIPGVFVNSESFMSFIYEYYLIEYSSL